jgi:CHAT domain-containing protein/tetratricopeptide (TPR) repeat protein
MVDTHTHGCPEPEVLAAYVDHGLSLAERARVEGHLASCPQCTALLAGVVRTAAEIAPLLPQAVETAEPSPLVTWRAVAGACTAAAAVIAVLAAPSLLRPWLERDAGLVSLASSVGEQRSVLGRLTGGFPHAPLDVSSAGGQDDRAAGTDRVLLTAGRIRESVGETATPSRLHALGVSQLLAGRLDDAAQLLLAASREQPANAQYLNDVAAVQLERARRGLRPDDLPRALAAADRARRLDASLREAWFNRALAISALSLTDQAKAAWTEYLRRDSSSPWASEARRRLEELSKPTPAEAWGQIEGRLQQSIDAATADLAVRTQTTEARQFIENVLLVEWANAVLAGNDSAAELERLRVMGDAMQRVAGDALYTDAVAAIDIAQRRGQESLAAIAAAHRDYANAASLLRADRFAEAGARLESAQQLLTAVASPFAVRASIDLGLTGYYTNQYDAALVRLKAAQAIADAKNYEWIRGHSALGQGLIAFAQSRLADAQAHYEATLGIFERMGDAEQVVSGHGLLASFYYYLGDKKNEWKHRQPMLQGLSVSRSARLRYSVMATAALSLRDENPEAALAIQDVVIQSAAESGRPAMVIEGLAQRASILLKLGRYSDATLSVANARARLAHISEPAFKQLFEIIVLSAESELLRERNAGGAVVAAQTALDIIKQRNNVADRSRLARINLQLAKANIARGRLDEAESALAEGIRAFDEERASLADEGRISIVDENWELFETGVWLAIKKGDLNRAFAMAERARARTLVEARRAPQPRALDELQARLAESETVVALNQFEEELAIWVISRHSSGVTVRPLTRRDAAMLVARQQEEIWRETDQPVAGRDLYNEIIRPIASKLRNTERLVFVPDATYQHASFAALWDVSRKRFLVEDILLAQAPSVESYVMTPAGNAGIARDSFVAGGPQDSATAEAMAIAAIYGTPAIVTGTDATSSRVLANVPGRSIVHLAAETSSNDTHPLLSRMILADEPGRQYSGAVFGRDIAARPLATTGLVVLGEVTPNTSNRGEGTLSLVRAFMAAGVPAVLGTLPGTDENAARDLMIGFHREMTTGIPAVQALSRVQRNAMQQNGRRLGAWTALVLYGSDR